MIRIHASSERYRKKHLKPAKLYIYILILKHERNEHRLSENDEDDFNNPYIRVKRHSIKRDFSLGSSFIFPPHFPPHSNKI